MSIFLRLLAPLTICLIALTACKPSVDKSSGSAPSSNTASATQAASTLRDSCSGEYSILVTPQQTEQSNKIEVLEFFGYFCSHCKSFDPALTAWAKKNAKTVNFKRVPIAFRDNMIAQQRMYYALEAMGKLETLHQKIFQAVQVENLALSNEAEIVAFLVKNGVDKSKFLEFYNSFSVQTQAATASKLQRAYPVTSVPMIALDGQYITSASHAQKRKNVEQSEAGLQTGTLQIMDELVAKSLAERKTRK
jgi:protein dithiol oxidoreductase (disulfide-forming)